MRVKDLAVWLEAPFEGDGDREVRRVAPLENASAEDVSFVSGRKAMKQAESTQAGCLLVPTDFEPDGQTVIRARDPRASAAKVIQKLHPRVEPPPGIHPTAILGPGVLVGKGVYIGPLVVIGAGVHIGDGVSIGAGCVIGDYVSIGEGCLLHPRVTIYRDVTIGRQAILHSGCVIGADGFGFVFNGTSYDKFPHVGRVEIGDQVEIGANACVDRAALGVTTIGKGTKLDNMVHVGHNCSIGRHVVIAAQTGISGGVVVEDYVVIGGQVGIADKCKIETRAILGAQAGIPSSKIIRKGQTVWGTPARPIKEHLEQLAMLGKLTRKGKL